MAFTYSKLAETTVGAGGASTITFNNIPQNYTDLVLKLSTRTNTSDASSGQWTYVYFNGTTTNNSTKVLFGSGSTTGSLSGSGSTPYAAYVEPSNFTASTFGNAEIYIPNYVNTNNKSFSVDSVTENNSTGAYSNLSAGLWSNTTSINTVTLTPAAGTFVQYSTAYLYGIRVEL